MARGGQSVRYSGAPKYNGIFGKPSYIEFAEIASPTPIEWQVGDYVDYSRTGFRYKLYTIPQVVKSSTSGTAGDAFVYKNVQFFCATKDLEIALFRDIVEYDNTIHFSSIPNVDTYENVYGIIDRIQANMDDYAPGAWTIRAMETSNSEITDLMSEVRQFSLSDGTCMDALNQIYSLWKGISWIYKVENGRHTIVLGRPNLQDASNTTPEFSYGEGNGLKVITRAVSTKNEMATRIYAYGSERNMPTRYYNSITPHIKDYESVYIPHLMLPLSDWGTTGGYKDARLAYIEDSSAIDKYGLIPKIMRFDGSGDMEDIYPSVEGMTVGDVADHDFPGTGWSSTDRIDEVVDVDNPDDDGMYTADSIKLKDDAISLEVERITKNYVTVEGQEAITLGNDECLVSSGDYDVNPGYNNGRFIITMSDLTGLIVVPGEYLADVPRIFVEVYVDEILQVQKEAKIVTTKMQTDFGFKCDDIKFTSNAYGQLKIYIRAEMPLSPTAPQMTVRYQIQPCVITVQVEYTIPTTFKVYTRQLGFDLNEMGVVANNGIGTLSMKTGMCAGREFVINKAYYDTDTYMWVLECQRQDDTSLMQYFPNSVYSIDADDRFVILDIQMPDKYVTAAMTRLHNAAADALTRLCKPVMAYSPEVDSKTVFLADVTLVEGLYMPVYDPDLIDTVVISEPNVNWILIDTVTIAENDDVIPVYGVTLRDEKVESMLQVLTGELNAANKRLRDMNIDESRRPAQNDPESVIVPVIVGVRIQCDSKLFVSDNGGDFSGQKIVLTAKTSGINSPTYRWFYKVTTVMPPEEEGGDDEEVETWVELEGEDKQTYIVLADSEIYFQDGRTFEDFMVRCWETPDNYSGNIEDLSDYYSDKVRISKGGRGPQGPPGADGDDGDDGYSRATIYLYQRFPTGTPSSTRVGNTTYTFSTHTLTGTLNGWSPDIPSGSGPIYVTMTNVTSQDDVVSIAGGWTTDIPAGAWTPPTRLTGDNGLRGKVMRGVNVWEQGGLDGGRPDGTDGYQGLDEIDSSVIFYDVVAKVDANGNITNYYYCKDGSDGNAALYAPWSQQGSAYWVEAENFDFIATKVLLADRAFIDILSGNGVYMYDDDGSASGNVVAGIQGGSTTTVGVQTVDQVNFFAGTDGTNSDPQNAPFRVYYDGSMVATKGQIGPYTIDSLGLNARVSVPVPGGNRDMYSDYGLAGFELSSTEGTTVDDYLLRPYVGFTASRKENNVTTSSTSITPSGLTTTGDVTRDGESVITFNGDTSYSNLGAILHVVHCTESRYNYLESNNMLDANTFYVITAS